MNYKRGDVVILPFPFVTAEGIHQKARPALVISDHSINRRFNDVTLAAITSQRTDQIIETEFLVDKGTIDFKESGLKKTSVVRCEYILTVLGHIIARKIGHLSTHVMEKIDVILKFSLGFQ